MLSIRRRTNSARASPPYLAVGKESASVSTFLGFTPELTCPQSQEALHHKPGSDQHHEREGDFGHHNEVARSVACAVPGAATPFIQCFIDVSSGCLNAGTTPKITPVSSEIPSVKLNTRRSRSKFIPEGQVDRNHRQEQFKPPHRQQPGRVSRPRHPATGFPSAVAGPFRPRLAPSAVRTAISFFRASRARATSWQH